MRNELDQASAPVQPQTGWSRLVGALFWTGASDLAAFKLVHAATLSALHVWTAGAIDARLRSVDLHGGELAAHRQRHWTTELERLRQCQDTERKRAGLTEFTLELYEPRDTRFAAISGAQNKATWLMGIATLAIVALVLQGYEDLLLAGVVGGLVSRAQRVHERRRGGTDYGLSWVQAFMAPVAGALAAWAGVEVLATLRDLDVASLDALFPAGSASVTDPTHGLIGLAVIFGFSERLLDGAVRLAETRVLTEERSDGSTVTQTAVQQTNPSR